MRWPASAGSTVSTVWFNPEITHGISHIVGSIEVAAATEELLEVRARDTLQLIRAAQHLGNRHVPVQRGEQFLRFQPDHLLGEMLLWLGCTVSEVK